MQDPTNPTLTLLTTSFKGTTKTFSKLKFKFDIQHVIYFNNKDNDSRIIFIKSFLTLMSSSSFNSVII